MKSAHGIDRGVVRDSAVEHGHGIVFEDDAAGTFAAGDDVRHFAGPFRPGGFDLNYYP